MALKRRPAVCSSWPCQTRLTEDLRGCAGWQGGAHVQAALQQAAGAGGHTKLFYFLFSEFLSVIWPEKGF